MRTGVFLLKCGVLAGLIGGALALPHLYHRVDEEVRRRVQSEFEARYPGMIVVVKSAKVVTGVGIVAEHVSVAEPVEGGRPNELLAIESLHLHCNTDIEELLGGKPKISKVVLRRPVLRLMRLSDGQWSGTRLFGQGHAPGEAPELAVEEGSLWWHGDHGEPLVLRDVSVTIAPERREADDRAAAPRESGDRSAPQASNHRRPPPRDDAARLDYQEFTASMTGDALRQIALAGRMSVDRTVISLEGAVGSIDFSPQLRALFPASWQAQCEDLSTFRGKCEAKFRLDYDRDAQPPCRFEVIGEIAQGHLTHPRLPHPLSDVRATVRITQSGVRVRRCTARCGTAGLEIDLARDGFSAESPMLVVARLTDLELDDSLAAVLPPSLQAAWRRFQPGGLLRGTATLEFDGERWLPELNVECLDVSFSYDKFPYRLEHCRGRLTLKDDVLKATELKAYSAQQPILLSLELHDPLGAPYGWLEAGGEIPLDEKLLAALPEQGRRVVQSLRPQGTIAVNARVSRASGGEPWRRYASIQCNRCSIRYERFPYPVYDITGRIDMEDDRWTVHELRGGNDNGRIVCRGSLGPSERGPQLSLRFGGTAILLEAELRDALPPTMRQVWTDFNPSGTCDLDVSVDFLSETAALDVRVVARPRTETAAITPVYFPCRLERLQGVLTYREGRVTLEKFRGEHAGIEVSAEGRCEFSPDGSWQFVLDPLRIERLRFDRDLVQALPAPLRKAVAALCPVGAVNVDGRVALARRSPEAPLTAQWNVGVVFQQAAIDCGVKVESMNGSVTLAGAYDGKQFGSRGELSIDSAMYRDLQFTRIGGPFWVDDQRVLFGSWVDRPPPGGTAAAPASTQQPRQISASLFDGKVFADGFISLADGPRYILQARLDKASLARVAQEMVPGRQNLQGTMLAEIELQGAGRSLNNLRGTGRIQLRNADVYETPLMAKVLGNLSARRPERSTFSSADVDFSIQGSHIYLRHVDFTAEGMNLAGSGEMNFQTEIRLTLHASLGRADSGVPVLRDVLGGASKQILQVHVGGTLANPDVRRQAFPALNQAIQQLQADRDNRPDALGGTTRRLPRK